MYKGKRVVIVTGDGVTYSGKIESYHDWGRFDLTPNRYIEFIHDEESRGLTGHPGYLKEASDNVVSIEITS